MNSIRQSIRRLFTPIEPIPAGNYHYQAPQDDPRNYRLHLRLEEGGGGVLIVNAATVLHLNQTAAEYAFYLVTNQPVEKVAQMMEKRYTISREQAEDDYRTLSERILALIETPDLDPVTFLDFERQNPFTGSISSPYRLDCALTYSLPEAESAESAPTDRVSRELTTAEWQTVLDKAWKAGIPHIVFTGGEPTLRPDLPELIAHAEANSQVTGLLTDGLRLADQAYLDLLLQTGLDHLMIILQPENELAWTALENALAADVFVAIHLTLTPHNVEQVPDILERVAGMEVKAISLSASDPGLEQDLQAAREQVAALDLELVWNLPTPYSARNPVALETGQVEEPEGAGRGWMYIEPDGDVLPAQGITRKMGNFLNDSWEKIWQTK